MAIDENSGCIDLFYAFTLRITFFLIHIYTIVTAFKIGGSLLGVITIPLPIISQIYWFIRIAISSGTIFNLYCVIIFIYLAFGISYIMNLMVKSYEGRRTPPYIGIIVVVVILALTIFIGYAVSHIKMGSGEKAEAWNDKGVDHAIVGRYDEAIESFNKAIEIKPDLHEAWYNKGFALIILGRYDEAIESFNKAIEIKPDYHHAWYNKGNALASLGRHEEAIQAYEKAIEIRPDLHEAWYNKGIALKKLGRKKEAKKAFKKADDIKKMLRQNPILRMLHTST